MASSSAMEVAIFADTSLGTHIAIAISQDVTAGDLKRELEREHLNCFPEVGEMRISKLMVKRKSYLYSLPESLPIKYAFQGLKGTWFIYTEACVRKSFEKLRISQCTAQRTGGRILNDSDFTDSLKLGNCVTSTNNGNSKCRRKRRIPRFHCLKALLLLEVLRASHFSKKKKRLKRSKNICFLNHPEKGLNNVRLQRKEGFASKYEEERDPCSTAQSPSEKLPKSPSVSDIINKYFFNYDEVTSASKGNSGTMGKDSSEQLKAVTDDNCSKININTTPQYTQRTPRRVMFSSVRNRRLFMDSSDKPERTEVGKRLVVASLNLGICASTQKPESSVCRSRYRRLSLHKSACLDKNLVYEISDEDD